MECDEENRAWKEKHSRCWTKLCLAVEDVIIITIPPSTHRQLLVLPHHGVNRLTQRIGRRGVIHSVGKITALLHGVLMDRVHGTIHEIFCAVRTATKPPHPVGPRVIHFDGEALIVEAIILRPGEEEGFSVFPLERGVNVIRHAFPRGKGFGIVGWDGDHFFAVVFPVLCSCGTRTKIGAQFPDKQFYWLIDWMNA